MKKLIKRRMPASGLYQLLRARFIDKKIYVKQVSSLENSESKTSNRMSTYLVLCLIILFSISLYKNVLNMRSVQKKITDKEAEVENIRREQSDLQKKLEFAQSQEFIESQLRNKLGLSKSGEIVVILPDSEILRKMAPRHVEEEIVLPDPNWKKWAHLFF